MSTWLRPSRTQLQHTLTPSPFLPPVCDEGGGGTTGHSGKQLHAPGRFWGVSYKQVAGPFISTQAAEVARVVWRNSVHLNRCIWRKRIKSSKNINSSRKGVFDVAVTNSKQEVINTCKLPWYYCKREAPSLKTIYGTLFPLAFKNRVFTPC